MKHTIRWIVAVLPLVLLALNACASAVDPAPSSPLSASDSPLSSPLQGPSPSTGAPSAGDPVDLAADDLADWLKVERSDVSVVSATETTMIEQGLGCAPGGAGDQRKTVDGTEIVLQVKEKQYVYRSDGKRIIRCDDGADVSAVNYLFELARADLATTLGIQAAKIELVQAEPMQWRNTSLGCPVAGQMYAQVITPGYRLTLAVDGEHYYYHTDSRQRFVHCEAR